jgi:riboflavin biosynthesis pyrimidine reductase
LDVPFTAFAARKVRDALDAALPPYVTEIEQPTGGLAGIGNEWTRRLFDGDFYLSPSRDPARPACSLVFVQSRDGNTGARNPSTLGGGLTDKHLIYEGLSRVAADAVLAGADTVRGAEILFSVWHPELVQLRAALQKPRHPIQIVATRRGLDVERELLLNVPDVPAILLTGPEGAARMARALSSRPWATSIVVDPGRLPQAFEELRRRGVERVSCVGGRVLAAQLIDDGLVQDVYLTTAARPGGEPNTPIHSRPLDASVIVRKRGTGREAGISFEHLLLRA